MKNILIIEREYGTAGSEIAEKAAQRLGWKLFDHAINEEIARLARMRPEICEARTERVDPWFHKLAKVFWHGSHERGVNLAETGIVDSDRLMCLAKKVVEEAAASPPCVIVGRGAPHFLHGRPDIFSVFLYAPRDVRYYRVLARVKDEAEALKLVDTVDDERAEFVKHYFEQDCPWPQRSLYDAMLNTNIGEDATVDAILYLMDAANKRDDVAKA